MAGPTAHGETEISLAKGWKRLVEVAAHRSGIARLSERHMQPSTVVLAYHNIVPHGETVVGDLGLHIDQAAFADHLDFILEGRDIVSIEQAFTPRDEVGRPRVILTFDDAYRGALTAGIAELRLRNLPATVFVPPGLLGGAGFWWDQLTTISNPISPDLRHHALHELGGDQERVLTWATEHGRSVQSLPEHARPVNPEELFSDVFDLLSFGAHTWSHPNLQTLDLHEAGDELTRCRSWLLSRTDHYVDWLAYPYGLVGREALLAAQEVFEGAMLISGGPAIRAGRPSRSQFHVPRINVPRGLSFEGLALRLAGLLA